MPPTTFTIPDMTCAHCEATLRAALARALPGAPVTIHLPTHQLTIHGDPTLAEAAIRDAGYEPTP